MISAKRSSDEIPGFLILQELLSKQMHYDWGLRAVKSLLRQVFRHLDM